MRQEQKQMKRTNKIKQKQKNRLSFLPIKLFNEFVRDKMGQQIHHGEKETRSESFLFCFAFWLSYDGWTSIFAYIFVFSSLPSFFIKSFARLFAARSSLLSSIRNTIYFSFNFLAWQMLSPDVELTVNNRHMYSDHGFTLRQWRNIFIFCIQRVNRTTIDLHRKFSIKSCSRIVQTKLSESTKGDEKMCVCVCTERMPIN